VSSGALWKLQINLDLSQVLPVRCPRSLPLVCVLGACVMYADTCAQPFTVLLGLLLAFRISDSYLKWERAASLTLKLHGHSRDVIGKMCAYLPEGDAGAEHAIKEVRRYLVLACVLIKLHIRGEDGRSLQDEVVRSGLLKQQEYCMLVHLVTTESSGPTGDGTKDYYPSHNRPAFAFQNAHRVNCSVHKLYPNFLAFRGVESAIAKMSNTFEEVSAHGARPAVCTRWGGVATCVCMCSQCMQTPMHADSSVGRGGTRSAGGTSQAGAGDRARLGSGLWEAGTRWCVRSYAVANSWLPGLGRLSTWPRQ
jgi:hypothetical protein